MVGLRTRRCCRKRHQDDVDQAGRLGSFCFSLHPGHGGAILEPSPRSATARHHRRRSARRVGLRRPCRQAGRPHHQSDGSRRSRASGGSAEHGAEREAHRHLCPRARLPRQSRGWSERAQWRRRKDRRSHLQPLRRLQETDAGHAAQRGCLGVRHPGCRRPLLHLHLDHGSRHAGGGCSAHPLRRSRSAQSARGRIRLGVRARACLALLRRRVPDPDRARPDRRRARTHDQRRSVARRSRRSRLAGHRDAGLAAVHALAADRACVGGNEPEHPDLRGGTRLPGYRYRRRGRGQRGPRHADPLLAIRGALARRAAHGGATERARPCGREVREGDLHAAFDRRGGRASALRGDEPAAGCVSSSRMSRSSSRSRSACTCCARLQPKPGPRALRRCSAI